MYVISRLVLPYWLFYSRSVLVFFWTNSRSVRKSPGVKAKRMDPDEHFEPQTTGHDEGAYPLCSSHSGDLFERSWRPRFISQCTFMHKELKTKDAIVRTMTNLPIGQVGYFVIVYSPRCFHRGININVLCYNSPLQNPPSHWSNSPAISLGACVFEFTSCLFDYWGFSVELQSSSSTFCKWNIV